MATRVLNRVLFVDGAADATTQDGSLDNPYATIQAAVDAIPTPTTVAASAEDWMVLIAPGDYNEDVLINCPVRLSLVGLGAFRLGLYTVASATQSNIVAKDGATKNLVWTYEARDVIAGGAAPQLVIATLAGTDVVRHGKPITNRISGSIVVQGDAVGGAAGGTAFLAVANTQVDAGITATETPTPERLVAIDVTGSLPGFRPFSGILVDRHFHSRFRGKILGSLNATAGAPPSYVLATSFMSRYEELVQVSSYANIDQAAFANGMTVAQVPGLGTLKSINPPGMVNSTFAGTFTGPAGSLLLDAATNGWFIRNGANLAADATKGYLGDTSATRRVTQVVTLTPADCGVTLLADATGGGFPVRLPPAAGNSDLTFTIKNVGSENYITVVPSTGEMIDGRSNSYGLVPPANDGQPPTPPPQPLPQPLPQPAHPPFFGRRAASVIRLVAHGGGWWIVARD